MEEITTVYLVRHSVRLNNNKIINKYNTTQTSLLKNEKVVLSVKGEKRAEILSNEKELQNIDVVYTSNCVRTLQTAKYLLENQSLKVNIDERLDERKVGISNESEVSDWFKKQYLEQSYKTDGGESQKEVRKRMREVFYEIVNNNKGKRIAIFSHGYAITFLLLTWCNLNSVDENHNISFSYKGKTIFDKKINSPEVFKLVLNKNNDILDIQNIVFKDLEYDDFFNNH